ncbi:peptidoglycan DD-metalloendopeptidase family protein [Candidatus Coxiella mudrowiae]|uniref:peptidoglycan DD-metalloendopeptidase family protein n=1 Tax=Candidatus Coxiella mudrowiae TaxID=2054173 RepID=UPI001FD42914|nr:peptidoglycan DD-metalloendopeptidase family protein [Candidatus Coxiella mudrowiae]
MIAASEDELVYVVAFGKVAFAKWLPDYGFLLIINHGHGYMTLYGRNNFLYNKVRCRGPKRRFGSHCRTKRRL